jgi:hypothetical protein
MVRLLMEARPRDSCTEFLKMLNLLPLASQYIFSLALFMVNNKTRFRQNCNIHNFNTRNDSNLFPSNDLPVEVPKSPSNASINIYNHLPSDIKDLACVMKHFEKALKKVLHVHSFYTIHELCIKLDKYFNLFYYNFSVFLMFDKYGGTVCKWTVLMLFY